MGCSDRDSAGPGADRRVGAIGLRASDHVSHALRRSILALCVVVGGLLLLSSPALASGGMEHVFGHSFKGEGKCVFAEPGGVAVSDATGEVYVFDRATNAFDRFSSAGACLNHRNVGIAEAGVAGNEGIAVDNSPTSPSTGDVYVVDAEEHAILKFKPGFKLEGTTLKPTLALVAKIKVFKEKVKVIGEEPEEHEFEEIHGLAVDARGDLWVYQGEEVIDQLSSATVNKLLSIVEVRSPSGCVPRPGFAVTGNAEFFYVGRERENRKGECEPGVTALMKLESSGEPSVEPARNAQLDNENTTGVAVDSSSGEVYFDNGTNISAFSPTGLFIQRFGDEEGSAHLQEGAGIAVDATTNDVYVADAHEGKVEIFIPKSSKESPPEPIHELPDHRAWEMVSPLNKFGATIFAIGVTTGLVQASEDGSAIAYSASAPIVATPPSNRSPEPAPLLSRRSTEGWSTEDIATPRSGPAGGYAADSGSEYRFFSSDLSLGLVEPELLQFESEPPLSPEATETTLYWRNTTAASAACEPTPSTCYRALVSPANDTAQTPFGALIRFMSATPDARHAVLKSQVALTPEAVEEEGLYEWEAGGSLQLVSVLPKGEEGTAAEAKLGERGAQSGDMRHAISNDGSRVIWSTEAGNLYLRDMTTRETIRVDEAQEVPQPEEAGAVFQTASADGSKIFFTDAQRLTPNSTAEEGVEELEGQGDLYVCEVVEEGGKPACKLRDLTAEVKATNESAAVQGVLGASEDGSYVYFVADGILAPDAGHGACKFRSLEEEQEETEGKLPVLSCNVYVEHYNGEGWEKPKLIAALTTEDAHDWQLVRVRGDLGATTSRVSPNGHYLAFMSNRSLTGYNNVDTHPEAHGARDEEVFLYNATSNRVLCASCNPKGEPPTGVYDTENSGEGSGLVIDRPGIWYGRWLAANIPGWTSISLDRALYQSRYLSDSGRLFFNSADSLVPAATNGKADVYEYEPNGEGSCESPTGCIALISSGTSKNGSAFLDASVSGNDVFFLTAEKLVAQDQDTAFDVYDAHVCTSSSPCLTPPPEPQAPCTGEACKAAISSQPALPSVPPSALPGPGNVVTQQVLGEKTEVKAKPKAKPLTRAQKLAKALKACKKLKKKSKRAACKTQAHKRYGPPKKKGKK
jgi:DNA-binding beta-propeller fold protein YncE